jgi:hypothetical protein
MRESLEIAPAFMARSVSSPFIRAAPVKAKQLGEWSSGCAYKASAAAQPLDQAH